MSALKAILAVAKSPEGLALLGRVAHDYATSRARYRAEHWGLDPARTDLATVRPAGQLASLGALAWVGYVTEKAGDDGPTLYEHDFATPLPLLCSTESHDLVILRGRSTYTITTHGIEG